MVYYCYKRVIPYEVYCQTKKTANTISISGNVDCVVTNHNIDQHTSRPHTFAFIYLTHDLLCTFNTIAFPKYLWNVFMFYKVLQ